MFTYKRVVGKRNQLVKCTDKKFATIEEAQKAADLAERHNPEWICVIVEA